MPAYGFFVTVFSGIRRESKILSLYRKIIVIENLQFGILYAVKAK